MKITGISKDDRNTYICGEWKSPIATKEFSCTIDHNGVWKRVDIIAYGEWDVYNGQEGRELLVDYYLGEEAVAEIEKQCGM